VAFPEIRIDEIEKLHGLQVTIVTTAGTRERGLALFKALGFPFKHNA
jgi:large subunit ribosomal protein L5